jgi:hypothetical protein
VASPAEFFQRHGVFLPAPPGDLARRLDVSPGATETEWHAAYAQRLALYKDRAGMAQPKAARLQNETLLRQLEALRPVLETFLGLRHAWQLLGEASDYFQAGQKGRSRKRVEEAATLLGKTPEPELQRWHDDILADLDEAGGPAQAPVIQVPSELRTKEKAPWVYLIQATGDATSFSVEGLPEGLVCQAQNGTIAGTPRTAGLFPLILVATNAKGRGIASVSLIVEAAAPVVAPPKLIAPVEIAAVEGAAVVELVVTSPPATTMSVTGLPEGLTFDPIRRQIVGAPTKSGEHQITINAANEGGEVAVLVALRIGAKPKPRPRDDFCQLLGVVPSTGLLELARVRERRLATINTLLRQKKLTPEQRAGLEQERALLEAPGEVIAAIKVAVECEAILMQVEELAGQTKPNATEITARLKRVREFLGQINEEEARSEFEQRADDVEQIVRALETRPPFIAFIAASLQIAGRVGQTLRHKFETIPAGLSIVSDGPLPAGLTLAPDGNVTGTPTAAGTFSVALRADYDGDTIHGTARWTIDPPVEPARPPVKGLQLDLTPTAPGGGAAAGVPIRLVARPKFFVGRNRSEVDFVTWFLPETDQSRVKTETISRVNMTLSLRGNQILVHNGKLEDDGKLREGAGIVIDNQPITASTPLVFAKERRIRFGPHAYELAVVHLTATMPQGPRPAAPVSLSTQPTVVVQARPLGCLRFRPVSCRDALIDAVWIFSEASVGSGPDSAVRIEAAALAPLAARFHHWQDGFWLTVVADGAVSLDGEPLRAGAIIALQAAHRIGFGNRNFELKVS